MDRNRQRLFDEHVLARAEGVDCLDRVPVVGCGDAHRVDVFVGQEVLVVGVGRHIAEVFAHLGNLADLAVLGIDVLGVARQVGFVDVAQSDHFAVIVAAETIHQQGAAIADPNESHPYFRHL